MARLYRIIVRRTISRAHESVGNFFARFFSRTSKETSLWDGGGSWDSSKKKRKKGATSVTGGGQGGTQGEYAFSRFRQFLTHDEANVFGPDSLRSLTRSFFPSRFRFQCLFHRDSTTSTIRSLMEEASRADERRTEAWPTGNFRIATIRGERAFSRGNLCYIIIDAISLRLTRLVVDPIPR